MRKPSKERSLAFVNPILSKEWDYKKNLIRPEDVFANSHKKVWWKCKKGHSYDAIIQRRNRGDNCPYCSGHRVCRDNCLDTLYPKLSKEWHSTKNGELTPKDFTCGSRKSVWWQCKNGHEWVASIKTRYNNHGCPYCSKTNKKVCKDNCLATVSPKLSKEWHSMKNGELTSQDVTAHTNKKVWWMCKSGHSYLSALSNRSNGDDCPYCSGRRVCKTIVWLL